MGECDWQNCILPAKLKRGGLITLRSARNQRIKLFSLAVRGEGLKTRQFAGAKTGVEGMKSISHYRTKPSFNIWPGGIFDANL